MRHRKRVNSLGRKAAHRKETLSSLATALILNKRINTTVAKAKALRVYVEPLITRSKEDSTHSRRTVFSYLKNKHAVSELFREVSQKIADRPGGYTRILKTGFRKGDAAEMCFIELVDYNTSMLKTEEETQQKRTRRGRRGGKKASSDEAKPAQKPAEAKKEAEAGQAEQQEAGQAKQQEAGQPEQPEAAAPEVKEEAVEQKPAGEKPEAEKPEAEKAKPEAEETKPETETGKEEKETKEEKAPEADAGKEEKPEQKDESEKKEK